MFLMKWLVSVYQMDLIKTGLTWVFGQEVKYLQVQWLDFDLIFYSDLLLLLLEVSHPMNFVAKQPGQHILQNITKLTFIFEMGTKGATGAWQPIFPGGLQTG